MNALFDLRMSKKEFLAWARTQVGRYELVGGRVVMQQPATNFHSRLAIRFARLLDNMLSDSVWAVTGGDFGVDIEEEVRLPDVMVQKILPDGKVTSSDEPVVLVEVLSPSSVYTDFTVKRVQYMTLPSLEAYVVVSQDDRRCWVWQRDTRAATRLFPDEPAEITGADGKISLTCLGIEISLAELYRGIVAA